MTERKYVPMDDVFTGVDRTVRLLNYMLAERSQLYGTIIYLMQMLEKDNIVMPPVEAMQEYHNSFFVSFDAEDDQFVVKLQEKAQTPPEIGEEEDGSEDE